jgi:uncharacterized protein
MKLLRNIALPLDCTPDLTAEVCTKLSLPRSQIVDCNIHRRSLDARKPGHLKWQYTLLLDFDSTPPDHPDLIDFQPPLPYISSVNKLHNPHPFIIGAGPAGLFCCLGLVEKGLKPIIFERGEAIQNRDIKIKKFFSSASLDPDSNIHFGEGGAGAYSDGKLTARNQDYYSSKVLNYLVQFGAPLDILYNAHPHLGTDSLKKIIVNIREYLISNGCQFAFDHSMEDLKIKNGRVYSISINGSVYKPEAVILASGNAARDLFAKLAHIIPMERKDFAAGFRIEHSQEFINHLFYGKNTNFTLTGAAEYRIKTNIQNRSVFSFCMCPGGIVVNAATKKGALATNGMSWSARQGKFANSAIVTPIDSSLTGKDILAGIKFQEALETRCFDVSGNFYAPAQPASDFIYNINTSNLHKNTFLPGTTPCNLNSLYPEAICSTLRNALAYWNKRFPGFADNGMLIAPETRTSSPVRILRNSISWQSPAAANLFPIGEGSGYAGGIISSAADGYKLSATIEF